MANIFSDVSKKQLQDALKNHSCPVCGAQVDIVIKSEEDQNYKVIVECSECSWGSISSRNRLSIKIIS